MGVVVFGGLVTSTLLSLILIPVVYTFVDDFSEFALGLFYGKSARAFRQVSQIARGQCHQES